MFFWNQKNIKYITLTFCTYRFINLNICVVMNSLRLYHISKESLKHCPWESNLFKTNSKNWTLWISILMLKISKLRNITLFEASKGERSSTKIILRNRIYYYSQSRMERRKTQLSFTNFCLLFLQQYSPWGYISGLPLRE